MLMNTLFFLSAGLTGILPWYIYSIFGLTVFLCIYFFYKATGKSNTVLIIIILWLVLQGLLAFSGFYQNTTGFPPRLVLIGMPPMLLILILFITKKGIRFMDSLDEKMLTILHVIRIPMELILWWLFFYKAIPQIMTFEGRNFDILAGLTAPIVFYFGYIKNKIGKTIKLFWNIISVLLLANIVFYAILSIPTSFQQYGLEQPNIAVLYFPFVYLPCCVVPIVFLSHFAVIRKLIKVNFYLLKAEQI